MIYIQSVKRSYHIILISSFVCFLPATYRAFIIDLCCPRIEKSRREKMLLFIPSALYSLLITELATSVLNFLCVRMNREYEAILKHQN